MRVRKLVEGSISLKIRAPFLFPGVDAGAFGYDRVALRDLDGNLIVPMDQIFGLLRHGLVDLGRTDVLDDLFGKGSDDAAQTESHSYNPDRSALFPSDLMANQIPDCDRAVVPAHRVRIDPESGAALEGHLLTLEQVAAPGAEVLFKGTFHAWTSLEAETISTAFQAALSVHGAVGAMKSVGFGEVVGVSVSSDLAVVPAALPDPGGDWLVLRFVLDRPYLIDAERIANNAYLGRRDIPGGAIKGLLAQNLDLAGVLVDPAALSMMRIGHARGVHDTSRMSPTFVQRLEERVHTRIDADTGAAFDQMLYSTIARAADPDGFECQLDLTGISTQIRQTLLQTLGRPLFGLGMTRATMTAVGLMTANTMDTASAGRVAIIVKTPALLAHPFEGDAAEPLSPADAYAMFWKSILPHSTLTTCSAGQRLAGGYHALRFRVVAEQYRPWVLTEPLSVFRFDLDARDVSAMNIALMRGLCRSELAGTQLDWSNCPFMAQNGYGEIAIHLTEDSAGGGVL